PALGALGFTGFARLPEGALPDPDPSDESLLDGTSELGDGDGLTTMGSPKSGLEDAIRILGANMPPATASTTAATQIMRHSLIGSIFRRAACLPMIRK